MAIGLAADLLDGSPCGLRTALEGLLQGFREIGQEQSLSLIHTQPFEERLGLFNEHVIPRGVGAGRGLKWSQFDVPRAIKGTDIELLHWPCQLIPSIAASVPRVISVWDLAPMNYRDPQWSRLAVFVKYAQVLRRALKSCDKIIVHCRAIADELIARWRLDARKIDIVSPGLPRLFAKEVEKRADYNPDGPILYVGTDAKRKNLDLLLASYARLVSRGVSNRLALRVTSADSGLPLLIEKVKRAGIPLDAVELVERCSGEQLVALYRRASVFAFPSWYEGFGLPLIEAMACGLPVVALKRSAMPEVIGESGVLVEKSEPELFSSGIEEAMILGRENPDGTVAASKSQAAKFSWVQAAKETTDVYSSVLGYTIPRGQTGETVAWG